MACLLVEGSVAPFYSVLSNANLRFTLLFANIFNEYFNTGSACVQILNACCLIYFGFNCRTI